MSEGSLEGPMPIEETKLVNQLASGLLHVGSASSLGGDLLQLSVAICQSNTHLFGTQHDVFPITMNKRAKFLMILSYAYLLRAEMP